MDAVDTVPAGCTTTGTRTYTATVERTGQTDTDTRTETIPATGHSFGAPELTTSGGSSSLTYHSDRCNPDFVIEFGITAEE